MHKSTIFGFSAIICFTLTACQTQQTTESIPATPIEVQRASTELPNNVPTAEPSNTVVVETEVTKLEIGDNAPAISIDHWVKGEAFDTFEDGKVYVMEFWATWCGPCITSMPHISSLQDQYGDRVQFTGVSSEGEVEIVTGFLEETNKSDGKLNSDRMRYTVAVDPDRSTSQAYMDAAGQNGIPTAFIIDADGKVAWIGHPMSIDEPLAAIVDGTWDLAAATYDFKRAQAQEEAMFAFQMNLRASQLAGDWDQYIASIDAFTAEYGENPRLADMKFTALLTGKKDKEAAYAWANKMAQAEWDDSDEMNAMAWNIVDEMSAEQQDLDFALKVATRGCELTEYKDPMILDTLARCYWEMGNRYKAIAWQEKAVEYTSGTSMDEAIKATLNEYKASLANVDE